MRADMSDLPFGKDSFDLIWCEGAAYIMGITEAFTRWKVFLRPEGYIAVTEISWLVPEAEVPRRAFDFFHSEYPGITDVPGNLARIEACGYEIVDHFTLPGEAWWTDYYTPLEAKLDALRSKYADDTTALGFLADTTEELRVRRELGDSYGYEFIVARLLDPDTVPPDPSAGASGNAAEHLSEPPDDAVVTEPAPYPPPLD